MRSDAESIQPKRILLADYTPPAYGIDSIDLFFNLHETQTLVRAVQLIRRLSDTQSLELNGANLKLLSVKLDNAILPPSDYTISETSLMIHRVPEQFTLETVVEINPEQNKSCSGLYLSNKIFATQCEAEGFRNITYFLDRPDVMTSYTVTIEADKRYYPVLLSNGDLISSHELPNGRHQAVWKDPYKKPSYLFALVAGDLGVVEGSFTTKSGKQVKLEVYASHGKQQRCHHALTSLQKAMKWDEDRFGLEYDLNQYMIVSIDDFNMGAMENKGLNIFNSRLVLADPESATDTDFDRIESVVGHEYFHNWTGNRITCRNWFELSLKEGLTVFRDQEFSSDLNSRSVQRIKDVDALRQRQFSEDAGPNAHPVRPESCLAVDNFYTPTIYEKGSELIRMMQTIVGTEGFRKGMNEYVRRHDGQAVTIMDFADAIASPNGADFNQFKLWYSQSGTPEVHVTENYDSIQKQYKLTLRQRLNPTEKQPHPQPLHIPLRVGLLNQLGADIKLQCDGLTFNSDHHAVLHLKDSEQTFVFQGVAEKPVLSLNRDFSAPIKLHWNASANELLHLIKYDSDPFNRREACFKMSQDELLRLIDLHRNNAQLVARENIVDAIGFIIHDESLDPQFKALMLQLPDDDLLAQAADILDAQAFLSARKALTAALVKKHEAMLIAKYKLHHKSNTSGDRALKNRILQHLILAGHPESVPLAYTQFTEAQNMTDTLGALSSLCSTMTKEKDQALATFFEKWQHDSVVFNKWLSVQSTAQLASTFDTVKALTRKPPFNPENPNNIYALISAFGDNYLAMQSQNGAPFSWLCDEIIRIDRLNPQVAANVCSSFNFIKKYPPHLKEMAQKEIQRVLDEPGLSRNSRELLEGCI